jgi:RNA polymerase sigma-70 factor (ECF subfamily)
LNEIAPLLRRIVFFRRNFLQQADVEDIVQDTLLSLHAVRATYNPERPFLPWLSAIVRNRMADAARKYLRRAANEVHVENIDVDFADDDANIESEIYGDPEELRQAVLTLPPEQRKAVELLKLRELSLKEASALTGTSVSALKVSAHRGLTALRKILMKKNNALN